MTYVLEEVEFVLLEQEVLGYCFDLDMLLEQCQV